MCGGLADQIIATCTKSGQCPDSIIAGAISRQGGPLHAQLGRFACIHFDDQRLDIDLGAARIKLVDDCAQVAVDRLAGGDDQRVGRWIGLNESGRSTARQRHLA